MGVYNTNIDKFYGTDGWVIRWDKPKNNIGYSGGNRMSIKKDCFAYRIGHCSIMTEMVCRRGTCSFYKTKEQDRQDREKYGFKRDYGKNREEV